MGDAIRSPGGEQAVQLNVAQQAVEAFAQLAQKNNTMIVPANLSEVAGLIGTHGADPEPRPEGQLRLESTLTRVKPGCNQ